MATKSCGGCSREFSPNKHNQIYCLQTEETHCLYCENPFQRICNKSPKKTCSKSCSSRLIRREQAARDQANCLGCGELFSKKISAQICCGKSIEVDCEGCRESFPTPCRERPKRYCRPSCRQRHIRATSYTMKPRNCVICEEKFTPQSSKSEVCPKAHLSECLWCGESFEIDVQDWKEEKLGRFCDSICSTLEQNNSKLFRNRTTEYKDINGWAKRFLQRYGRKPTAIDTRIHFGVDPPVRRIDKKHFDLPKRESSFERFVVIYLEEKWSNLAIARNKKPLRGESGNLLEIDIWITELNLGIEVQDFATHSRDREDEPSRPHYSDLKVGPTYHRLKREAAQRAGIDLVEIWEDQIFDQSFKEILDREISSRLEGLS